MKAIAALLDLVPSWVWAAAVVALSAMAVVLTLQLSAAEVNLAHSQVEVADLNTAIADANTKAAQQQAELASIALKAQNEAKKRENDLRIAAASAAAESGGLRDELTASRLQYDKLSRDAVIERANAVSAVLADCSRRYQGMAEVADRHASDVKTLIDSWPRSTPASGKILKP